LLFQTGYLTIKEIQFSSTTLGAYKYVLGIPNVEVEKTWVPDLWKSISKRPLPTSAFHSALEGNDHGQLIGLINGELNSFPAEASKHVSNYEGFYHFAFHMLL